MNKKYKLGFNEKEIENKSLEAIRKGNKTGMDMGAAVRGLNLINQATREFRIPFVTSDTLCSR